MGAEVSPDTGADTGPDTGPATTNGALRVHTDDPGFAQRVAAIAAKLTTAGDAPSVHALFRDGVAALGASSALFVSFVRDDQSLAACRFMPDCDPAWGRLYLQDCHYAHDPWLAYAAQHSEPVAVSALHLVLAEHRRVQALAAAAGFASVFLVPAHSGAGHARTSVLCLGSPHAGYFEAEGQAQLRVAARMLAMELHDWCLARIRHELVVKARISSEDLLLLEHQCLGHSSKRIADELHVSKISVDSRFQRMNAKLGVGTRRKALQLAIDCGLLVR